MFGRGQDITGFHEQNKVFVIDIKVLFIRNGTLLDIYLRIRKPLL